MVYYLILYVISLIFFIELYIDKNNNLSIFSISSISIVTLFLFFKGSAGQDFYSYIDIYKHVNESNYVEKGFLLLVQGLNFLSVDARTLFIFVACVTFLVLIYVKYKIDNELSFIFLLLLLIIWLLIPYAFNGIRQYLVQLITFLYLTYLYNSPRRHPLLVTCVYAALAISIHSSGIIIFIIYLMSIVKISVKKMITCLLLITSILAYIGVFKSFTLLFLQLKGGDAAVHEYMYVYNEPVDILSLLQKTALLVAILYIHQFLKVRYLANCCVLALAILIIFSSYSMIATRLYFSFAPIYIFYLSMYMKEKRPRLDRLFVAIGVIGLLIPGYVKDSLNPTNKLNWYYEVNSTDYRSN